MNFGKIGTNGKPLFGSAKAVPIPDVSTELDWDFVTSDPKRQRLDTSESPAVAVAQPAISVHTIYPMSFTRPSEARPELTVIPQPQPLYQPPQAQPQHQLRPQPQLSQSHSLPNSSQPIDSDLGELLHQPVPLNQPIPLHQPIPLQPVPNITDKRPAQPSLHPLPKRPAVKSPPDQPFSTPPQASPPKPSRVDVTFQQQPLTPARPAKTVLPRRLEGALSRVPPIQQLPPESPILLSKLKLAVSSAPPVQDFQSGIWVAGLRQRGIHPFGATHLECNIEWILSGGYERKIPRLLVVVRTFSPATQKCLVVDPSGEMDGAIDRKTLDMYPGLAIGTLIELKNVAVYTRGLDRHILNITLNNVISVEAGLPRLEEDPIELEDPAQSYSVLELPEERFSRKPQMPAVGVLPKKKESPPNPKPKANPSAGRGRKQAPRPNAGPPPAAAPAPVTAPKYTPTTPKFTPPPPAKQPAKQPPLAASTSVNIDVAPKLDQFRRPQSTPAETVTPVPIKSGPVTPSSASVIAAEVAFLEGLSDDFF